VPFACEEFQVFHFRIIVDFFSFFYHVQSFFSSLHCTLFKKLLRTLRSYGVKASEHE